MDKIKKFIENAGWPRVIIGLFLLSLYIAAPFVNVRVSSSLSDTLVRVGMNGVLVLAMVPMVQSGCGLNFGLPLGIIAGLLGATTSIQHQAKGLPGFGFAILVAVPIAVALGFAYAQILNRVKGEEMMIATYVGFSSVAAMCMAWLLLPFTSPVMVWGYGGSGLRTTISTEGFWRHVLSDIFSVRFGPGAARGGAAALDPNSLGLRVSTSGWSFFFPTGMFIFFFLMMFLVWAFFKTKTGTAITAVGSNPEFARASGIDVNKMRTISVILSTVLGALGILVYEQSFGFIQLYMGPLYMAFPAVAAILLGGASVNKATMTNVIVGTFLFQGILTMTPSVINSLVQSDMSEVIRIMVSNGMILYALTRKTKVKR